MTEFLEAIAKLARSMPLASRLNSAQWQRVAPAIREKAFFSATVDSAKTLRSWREMLLDWLQGATEEITLPDGTKTVAFKEVSLAKFRERAARFAIQEGLATEEDYPDQKITNVISNARLKLVFNTNIEQSQEFAYWKQRVGNADYLNRYPAAKFVRRPGGNPMDFRPVHVAQEGTIKRWDDFTFWKAMNDERIGGFGVPWGPWGFNSYMRQEPVSRARAVSMGLVRADERIKPPNARAYGVTWEDQFLGNHKDEMDDVPEEIKEQSRRRLIERLGPGAIDSQGRPSLKALREHRRRLQQRRGFYGQGVET